MISVEETVAGAPFFFGEGEPLGVGFGVLVSSGDALALAEGEGDSPGDGLGVGDDLCFFFLLVALGEASGVALGDDFFFFTDADALGEAVSAGVGLAADFFFGDGDFSGVAVGFGVGDFSAVDFFFVCLRGVGVGVGSKIFLSFVPSDSSAGARTATAPIVAATKRASAILIVRCIADRRGAIFSPARRGRPCSGECRLPNSRAENFHWANARGSRATPAPSRAFRLRECRGTARRSECCRLRE